MVGEKEEDFPASTANSTVTKSSIRNNNSDLNKFIPFTIRIVVRCFTVNRIAVK